MASFLLERLMSTFKTNVSDDEKVEILEAVIDTLDDKYHVLLEPCVLPVELGKHFGLGANDEVPNPIYDQMRHELELLCPDSELLKKPAGGNIELGIQKIQHDPPMTSIQKASHEDRSIQEQQLFKWLVECVSQAPATIQSGPAYDLAEKSLPVVDLKTGKPVLNHDGTERVKLHNTREYNGSVVKYPRGYFYMGYKFDGVALALYYENGNLVKAGLRPRDGINGEDVTEQVKYVDGILQKLPESITCSIRGELICKLDDFEKVQQELQAAGEKIRANPRNHAGGGIRQFKDPQKVKSMRLSFMAYAIEGLANPPYKTEIERAIWCNKTLKIPYVRVTEFNFYSLEHLEENVKNLNYEVDGVIIGVNDIDELEQLGRIGDAKIGNPRGKIAWKFAEERATVAIKDIEWNTGRTGKVVPKACFNAVRLAGTNVERATLHNIGFMLRNKIGIGTEVTIVKAGKIIPKVIGVKGGQTDPIILQACPSCGGAVEITTTPGKNGEQPLQQLYCTNKLDCPSQNINRLCHYLSVVGVLGLGESRVTQLANGVVSKLGDFYRLDTKQAMQCGLSERQALLAIAAIHMIPNPDKSDNEQLVKKIDKARKSQKSIPAWKFFSSLGIESAGKSAGKALIAHFGSFDAILQASVEELRSVKDVGDKTAEVIRDFFDKKNDEITDLLNFVELELPKVGKLTGQKFVFTGGFAEGKKHWETAVENEGGQIGSSVSKDTNYVVEGTDAGSKADKAKKLGIPLITVDQLRKML